MRLCTFIMAAQYGRPLSFRHVVSSFFLFSSPILSGRRLDVYHTFTHDVASVWMHVWNVLHAACWKYRTQKIGQKLQSAHHTTTLLGYIFATKACIDNWKIFVKQQYLLHISSQYGEHRPTSGWDRFGGFGVPQQISTGFSSWLHYCSDVAQRKSTKLCTMFGYLLWASAHILVLNSVGAVADLRNFIATFRRLSCR